MSLLQDRMKEEMILRGFSESTIKGYMMRMAHFTVYLRKSPILINAEDIRSYFLHLIGEKKASYSVIHMTTCSLKFFLRQQGRQDLEESIPRIKRPYQLASVMNISELGAFLDALDNLRNRAIFTTIYCCGLRLGEACRLDLSDIDPQRMQIKIRSGKGQRDRYTMLFKENLEVLRAYIAHYRPQTYMFYPRGRPQKPLHGARIEALFRQAKRRAGIRPNVTVHTLRHTFATQMLENGASILVIQKLLGHSSIRTTLRYLHLRDTAFLNLKSPLHGSEYDENPLMEKDQMLLAYSSDRAGWR